MSSRRNYSDKHALPANPSWIEISRSDGDSSTWPQNTTPTVDSDGHVNFMRPVDIDEGISCKWRVGVGMALAAQFKYPEGAAYVLKQWPTGYKMFDHNKGPQNSPRHDVYLMGSKFRFRSVPEFIPHAIWLMSDPATTTNPCACKYCSKKPQRDITSSMSSVMPKRISTGSQSPAPSRVLKLRDPRSTHKSRNLSAKGPRDAAVYANVQRVPKPVKPGHSNNSVTAVLRERNSDLRAVSAKNSTRLKRWHREGELLWCALTPPILGSNGESNSIKFWPGIVEEWNLKPEAVSRKSSAGPSSVSANHTNVGHGGTDVEPVTGEVSTPWTVRQSIVYKVRLLAVSHNYLVSDSFVLPYQAYAPSNDLINTMREFPSPQLDLDPDRMSLFNPCEVDSNDTGPSDPNAPARRFAQAISPYAVALQIGAKLSEYWCLTDDWDFKHFVPHPLPTPSPTQSSRPTFGASSLQSAIMAASSNNATIHHSVSADPGSISRGPAAQLHEDISGIRNDMTADEIQQIGNRILGQPPIPGHTYTQKRYQGLWWGAERIWTDELVRLKIPRGHLAPAGAENIHPPSGMGASQKGVFMRLDGLFLVDVPLPDERGTRKECRASGMLYELADEDWVDPRETNALSVPGSNGLASSQESPRDASRQGSAPFMPHPSTVKFLDSTTEGGLMGSNTFVPAVPNSQLSQPPSSPPYPLPVAPKGYKFRPILPPGYESAISLSLISGRYYPQLLSHPLLDAELQNVFSTPIEKGGIMTGNNLFALEGLTSGFYNSVDPVQNKTDRLTMIRDADHTARDELVAHLSTMLSEHMGEKTENNPEMQAGPAAQEEVVSIDVDR